MISGMSSGSKLLRIFYTEDDESEQSPVESGIRQWRDHVEIQKFSNHDLCWEQLQAETPDLLIMDLYSGGGMNGLDLLRQLAKQDATFPILIISGSFSLHNNEGRAKQAAGKNLRVYYLTKPFPPDLFQCALQTIAENDLK
jgi:CheY-like chemotaxis protein